MSKQEDLTKVSIVTILGLSILLFSLFWLKGHKLYNLQKVKVYFEDVSGLEEGSIVRWSGLRVGVVENLKPVLRSGKNLKSQIHVKNEFLELSNKEIEQAKETEDRIAKSKDPDEIKTLTEKLTNSQDLSKIHLQQGLACEQQRLKESKNHVELTLVITKKDVPLGPLSTVSIVPVGLIGEQYVEISPIINKFSSDKNFKQVFITQEPLRFERFLRANIESSEAFKEAITKINKLLKDEDVELLISTIQDVRTVVNSVNKLTDNASVLLSTTSEKLEQLATSSNALSKSVTEVGENINKIIGDDQVQQDFKSTTSSLKIVTAQAAKLLDEQGLAKDILEISQTAKDTSHELSTFIKDLRQTQEDLKLPKTVANLNSLSEKLDKLTDGLNSIVADKDFKENIKVTAQKARETSENLQKISKKYNRRFLLFRLLF
jgi:ABC-type transporter Mla subunit MlaD